MVYDRIRMERGILLSTEGGECYNHCKTVGQRVCLANDFSLEGSDCENFQGEDEIDDSEIDLMQSRLSATGPDVHYEMNVICKLECQQCKGMFKPYAYHRHLEHCQKENTAKALNLSITKPSRVSRCKSSRSKSPLSHYPQPELYRQLTSNARS